MSQQTLEANPDALAMGVGGLPASREVARSLGRKRPLTRRHRYVDNELDIQEAVIDAWRRKAELAIAELGHVNVFTAATYQHTLQGMSAAAYLPGCPQPIQVLAGQFLEAAATSAGQQMLQLENLAAASMLREFARALYPEGIAPEEAGLLRRLLGAG
jgi:hypothetical protein